MLKYSELKVGTVFRLEGQVFEVIEYEFLRMQASKPVAKVRLKNLTSGQVVGRNFHSNETFEEVEAEWQPLTYLYSHRGEFWFSEKSNPKNRFKLSEEQLGEVSQFLKPNTEVSALKLDGELVSVKAPIKVDFKVTEAPPGERGNTAQGGNKIVTLETGAKLAVPLFINTGDIVRVNTVLGEYVERVEKSKE
ncbi:MAG: elongation factor P [bacterium]|nr:elongation factor P [bacterium]